MSANVNTKFLTIDDLKQTRVYSPSDGIREFENIVVYELEGPPPLAGAVCKIDLSNYEFRVFPFRDLINKSLHPSSLLYGSFCESWSVFKGFYWGQKVGMQGPRNLSRKRLPRFGTPIPRLSQKVYCRIQHTPNKFYKVKWVCNRQR